MAGAPPPDDSSLVVVLLDTSLHFWNAVVRSSSGLQQVLSFLNSLALMNHMNHLVIIASGCNSCEFLYDSLDSDERAGANHQTASEKIVHKLNDFVSRDATQPPKFQPSLLSASLSMALCYIQRALKEKIGPSKPRMLCLQASPDAPHQYIAIMNAIFSAQRSMVPIDACMVGAQHSAFLQQAADITGGTYLMPQQADSLLEYLMTIFTVDLHSRQFIQLPRSAGVDFRASCFCHKRTIDMGYICSVCLSIFCKQHKECSTCGSSFASSGTKRKTPAS
ncbi:general transcription and DNA repair factor IIH subunit TFB4 isoform X4 [Selaginella moellendorffii]|uniref:general transcription and DNA repair factor IIH subunit TFB4 isoform X4 n=1 Tax=Selaginella moellendorffii TaxID=88036 RepID=UPI000D1C5F4D|nr:general transcription and DNA repair factor IIH subunit TFB4 isoform X4 [Selaginella moellendorffii]|eukprot:XP_024522776.1 general transcription and DNA repair factor IIH subunit TFB4 isoform X4 [Selaginella moellendorffii]